MTEQVPSVGRIVHYRSFGSPGGEYMPECRAALITQVGENGQVGLAVLNPTGMFFNPTIDYHDGAETPGDPDCPANATHGNPFRYCSCGWTEASFKGGTWHWPERVPPA